MSDQITHIHHNVPGVLARINQVLAAHPVNILGQYLKTNERIGYVIIDVDEQYEPAPNFTLPTPEGKPIALSSLRGQ